MEFSKTTRMGVLQIVNQDTGLPRDRINNQTVLGEHAQLIVHHCGLRFGKQAVVVDRMTFYDLCDQLGLLVHSSLLGITFDLDCLRQQWHDCQETLDSTSRHILRLTLAGKGPRYISGDLEAIGVSLSMDDVIEHRSRAWHALAADPSTKELGEALQFGVRKQLAAVVAD